MLSGVPFNPIAGHVMSLYFGSLEFIRETVWELGELTGDVVMFMFVTTDSALPRGDCLQLLTGPW